MNDKAFEVDPHLCPLCGQDNCCGYRAGTDDCWCFHTSVPMALRERITPELRGKTCICRDCVEAYHKEQIYKEQR
ncbi:cysteine-rich CWC family protein [Paenibacillus terrigena]|uniref:cysteine-rich CWC family protein n=1 Tax=Paenibacillus terrigena TaxID=369333 RepID=UPI0028D72C45|nr:cysteine-rich CWC family protein [Paenibacillus terrigena]